MLVILKIYLTINFFSLSFMKEVTKKARKVRRYLTGLWDPVPTLFKSFHVLFSGTIFGFRLAFPVDISGTTELGG